VRAEFPCTNGNAGDFFGHFAGTSLAQLDAVRPRLPVPIAIALNSFDSGGTERQMVELICRLDRRLFDVHVVCLGDRGPLRARLEETAVSITEFPIRSLKSIDTWRQMLRFARWCRSHDIQAVHACDFYTNVFALPAAAIARVPVRIGSRRDVFMPERTAGQQRLQRLAYQLAHRVVTNSSAAAQRLIEEGVPDWKLAHVANGLALDRFATDGERTRRRVITTVANLRPGKGHEILLKAAARVIRRVPDAQFRIVGDGPRRQMLERQAATLRISAQVEFAGHREDVPGILQASDVFAFPSFMEASPNAVLEAMAAGLPVVATRVGGIPEVIEHERSGLLVPPGDDRALAAGILRFIERPAAAAAIGEAARQTVDSRFSFDRMVSEFQGLYFDELAARVAPEALTWAASSGN
jgi:glycosyltransferase involved in cell wall biosynthesis